MLNPEILDTFVRLLDEAKASGEREPTAMNLATVDGSGRVASRIVLLKGVDERGLRFHTNYQSDKGSQLEAHPQVALCFHWKQLREGVQVRVEGAARKLQAEESDAYFATRARGARSAPGLRCSRRPCRIAKRSNSAWRATNMSSKDAR
jgi:pyridoxamine 5'-phosphate oxidase